MILSITYVTFGIEDIYQSNVIRSWQVITRKSLSFTVYTCSIVSTNGELAYGVVKTDNLQFSVAYVSFLSYTSNNIKLGDSETVDRSWLLWHLHISTLHLPSTSYFPVFASARGLSRQPNSNCSLCENNVPDSCNQNNNDCAYGRDESRLRWINVPFAQTWVCEVRIVNCSINYCWWRLKKFIISSEQYVIFCKPTLNSGVSASKIVGIYFEWELLGRVGLHGADFISPRLQTNR